MKIKIKAIIIPLMKTYYTKTLIAIVFAFFLSMPMAYAGFSISGSTITQSGTDSDLSGLSSVSGVTTTAIGSGNTSFTIYNVGNRTINVTGNLTINPRKEQLWFGTGAPTASFQVNSGAVVNLGLVSNYSGQSIYDDTAPFVFTKTGGSAWAASDAHVRVLSGGTMNMYGVTIYFNDGRGLFYDEGSNGTIRDVKLKSRQGTPRTYLLGDNLNVDGITVSDFNTLNLNGPLAQFKGYTPYNVQWPIFYNGGTNDNSILTIRDFEEFDSDYTIVGQGSTKYIFINKVTGTENYTAILRGNVGNFFVAETRKEVALKLIDDNGAVENAKVYITDTNNGARKAYTAGDSNTNFNYIPNLVYQASTNANGEAGTLDVLTSAVVVNSSADAGNAIQSNPVLASIDYRGETTDGTDRFTIHLFSYNHQYNPTTKELKGAGVLESEEKLFFDTSITETTKATVDAYTSIDNLDQLYDRAKSWKVDVANIEYPTIGTQPVTANGTELDLGNQNLMVDGTAGSAFAVNTGTNTITIKASTLIGGAKFTNIKTTGTISTAGGSSLEIGYQDNTGTYKYIALSNLVNADILIRDNTTGPVTNIVSIANFTGDYKTHFLAPTDASDTEVVVSRANYSNFSEIYPENDLSFIRTVNLQLTQVVAESQIEMLNLAIKILQKEEALYRALDLTNPPMTVNNTISGSTGSPSVNNQEAILNILNKVFAKVIANRRKLE